MEVVVQPDDRPSAAITTIALDHLAPVREPRPAVRLNETTTLVTMDVGLHDVDAGNDVRLFDSRHSATFYQPPPAAGAAPQSSVLAAPRK
jgi:hypothetical protein